VGVGLPPYGYTVGLPLHFDHAELVLVGLDRDATLRILNLIGSAIANGARLAPGDPLDVDGMSLKVGRRRVARTERTCRRLHGLPRRDQTPVGAESAADHLV